MNWDRVNVWTCTLYTIVQSLQIARQAEFHPIDGLHINIVGAKDWVNPQCSFASTLVKNPFGKSVVKFRRKPEPNFETSVRQIVRMLTQDLTVIFDEMMDDSLKAHGFPVPNFPQSKVEKLATVLDKSSHDWCRKGCLELVAVRNALAHGNGRWNEKSLEIIKPFVLPLPDVGDVVILGVPMLFQYRKAIRTFLNQTAPLARAAPAKAPKAPSSFGRRSRRPRASS